MPVVGLKVLRLSSSNLGLLFTSMGAGSVIGAVFIIPWLRARFSPDAVTLSANMLLVLVYVLMALVRQTEVFFVVAALAGVGWTMSASELWVAAQRAMPAWARGRMNATVIVISQGAMALGGVIWGSAAAIAGASFTLLGAAMLFLMSLFWLVGFRSTPQKTSNRGYQAIYLSVSNQKRTPDGTHKRIACSLKALSHCQNARQQCPQGRVNRNLVAFFSSGPWKASVATYFFPLQDIQSWKIYNTIG